VLPDGYGGAQENEIGRGDDCRADIRDGVCLPDEI